MTQSFGKLVRNCEVLPTLFSNLDLDISNDELSIVDIIPNYEQKCHDVRISKLMNIIKHQNDVLIQIAYRKVIFNYFMAKLEIKNNHGNNSVESSLKKDVQHRSIQVTGTYQAYNDVSN